jgi:RNA polymerase sigma-70 factor, ECF subfamily
MTVFSGNPRLLAEFRAGNRDSMSTVYWFFVSDMEAVIRRGLLVAGVGARVDAQSTVADLVQDVFVRAFGESARLSYDGKREYRPFLKTIARNVLIDYLRRQGRERCLDPTRLERLVDDEVPVQIEEPPYADPPTLALVEQYLASLPAPEHQVYRQRYALGRSQEQAASALCLTRQQVRTLEARVRTGLARALARAQLSPGLTSLRPSWNKFEGAKGDQQ